MTDVSFVNDCGFRAASNGTGDFVVAAALTGLKTPAQCSNPAVVNAAIYGLRAESDDGSEWEESLSAYTVGSTSFDRATILDSTNAGAKVNFTAAPKIRVVLYSNQILKKASVSESGTGSDDTKAVSPAGLFPAEADIASASTCAIGAATTDKVRITGTTGITSFGTIAAGIKRVGRFAGALTLTHNGTSLILPGGANITTAAGDTFEAYSLGSGNWVVTRYNKANGKSVIPPAFSDVTGNLAASQLIASVLAALEFGPFTDIASAGTTDLSSVGTIATRITGTTTITSLGAGAKLLRVLKFAGALTLTHNATSLILPGGANITTAAGDTAMAVSDGSGNWTIINYTKASGKPVVLLSVSDITDALGQGKHTIWIPAKAMKSRTTNGPSSGAVEMSSNKNMFETLDFDTTTQEFAQFEIAMPKSWNEGTVTFQPVWSHPSTSTNFGIAFGLAGVATSDDDAGDVAFGTAQTSVDTGGTTNDIYIGPESSAITIAGSPADNDRVQFQINRTVADAGDTMAVDARLHGIKLYITLNAATDT